MRSRKMWQDPKERYRFKLHHCEGDNHYHLILGLENISWPFWSLQTALAMIEFTGAQFVEDFRQGGISRDELSFGDTELIRIEEEIHRRSLIKNSEGDGGFLMPHDPLPHEGNVAEFWGDFLRGDIPYMCYRHIHATGTYLLPLYCDFIHRTSPKPESATRSEWIRLAQEPVTRVTMEELGIMLDPR